MHLDEPKRKVLTCLELNSGLDRDKYYYQNNQCKVDPCNEGNYRMCDESGCNSLSYRYRFKENLQ